ncbi:acid phosphatase type 7-like [Condylostylus longicornis]|uniref:acid phosphatase type 7-like n=1 Tax=Condylostylus longicornis TaxID=2530218 RepID=UPI00244E280F|nr:acid phosphatase type 7-like [Condylostylus longicornis]XP_055377475.1 acid phosphatase type 7-like [Condylostylus longicornis]
MKILIILTSILHIYTFKPIAFNLEKVYHYQPQQIHIALGNNINEITITWSTFDSTNESIVEYGINGNILTATGSELPFVDGGSKKHTQYIHKVTLQNLKPDMKYWYHCGSNLGWSAEFWFKTPRFDSNWSPSFAIFGDMGNENAKSLARLQEDTQRQMYDAILHVGDFAYDMDTENAEIGDEFMRQIETIAAYVPYMVCSGNHEEKYNFSNYRSRFNMPHNNDNLYYSFDIGPIHFIAFSTEVYYFLNYGIKSLVKQYEWLEKDLKEATKPENRAIRPWIITFGHRPMYCSDLDGDDCTKHETLVRNGLPVLHFFGLEDLFYNYGVDVEIWAHEHSYERLWPIYDYKIYNGSLEEPYTNPGAPVHIITGSAGCKEGTDTFPDNPPEWSAFHTTDYGYTRMKAFNKTHLYFEQVSDNKSGSIVDSFWIIKNNHGKYK